MNHGHVKPNPDGSKARCGGPAICTVCALELAQSSPPATEPPGADWLRRRLAIADDTGVTAGRPCDGPPGCNATNCLGCGEPATDEVQTLQRELAARTKQLNENVVVKTRDMSFLREMLERFDKGQEGDVTESEMVRTMIDDWHTELEETTDRACLAAHDREVEARVLRECLERAAQLSGYNDPTVRVIANMATERETGGKQA